MEHAFAASARFHALPEEDKRRIPLEMNNCGYMSVNASMQRHSKVEVARQPNYNASFFCKRDRTLDDPDVIAGKPFRGLNQWPADLPGFREDVVAYSAAAEPPGMRLLPVVARALDLPADTSRRPSTPAITRCACCTTRRGMRRCRTSTAPARIPMVAS